MKATYWHERWRAVSAGILEAAGNTFLLLVAVRWFHAGATAKGLIASAGSLGLMLTPLVVSLAAHRRWTASRTASRLAGMGSLSFLVMAAMPVLPVFMVGSMVAMAASSGAIPLLTHMYQENYPGGKRGSLFSHAIMIRIAVTAGFSMVAGRWLEADLGAFRWLLVVFAGAFAFAAYHLGRCPSSRISNREGVSPLRAIRYIREDGVFRLTLICWMLMGFANLMMNPMRVEMLANPKYGANFRVVEVAFFVSVVPNIARLIMSPIWGWLFDRMNFFVLRVVLNLGFALGIIMLFTTNDRSGLWIGSIIYGVSNGGGDIAWSLWVTKFAPPERVADYMAVHTFLTGVRGMLAPLAAFHLATQYSLSVLGWVSAGLIVVASLMLLPEVPLGRKARKGTMLTEEGGPD